jgi:hypothetical protein
MDSMARWIDRYMQDLLDMQERIRLDLPCLSCGYNLRSLHLLGQCPECGAPIRKTVEAHIVGSVDWVQRLDRGASYLVSAIGTLLAAAGLLIVGVSLLGRSLGELPSQLVVAFLGAFALATALQAVYGLLLLAARDPRRGVRREGLSIRRMTIVVIVLALVAWAVFGVWWLSDPPRGARIGRGSLIVAIAISVGVLPPLILWHLSNLLRRAGSHGTTIAARVLAGVLPLFVLGVLCGRHCGWLDDRTDWLVFGVGGLLACLASLIVLFTKAELSQWLKDVWPR